MSKPPPPAHAARAGREDQNRHIRVTVDKLSQQAAATITIPTGAGDDDLEVLILAVVKVEPDDDV